MLDGIKPKIKKNNPTGHFQIRSALAFAGKFKKEIEKSFQKNKGLSDWWQWEAADRSNQGRGYWQPRKKPQPANWKKIPKKFFQKASGFLTEHFLKRHSQKVRVFTLGLSFTVILVILTVLGFQLFGSQLKSATYGWLQTTWTGGADTNALPTHTSNQTNWNKYYSSDGLTVDTTLQLERTSSGE